MSKVICIAGETGSGKTSAMRTLDPKQTYYIDCDKKGLAWKGWRDQYNAENKNYKSTDDAQLVKRLVVGISAQMPDIKFIVIDTLNGIMIGDEMRRMREKGYDKWIDLAASVWDIVDDAYSYRDDLTIIFLAHTQTERSEDGYVFTRIKTSGKKLEKITLESKFTTVLIAKIIDGKHVLETRANNSTAKTPIGAFETETIENDIMIVLNALEEY